MLPNKFFLAFFACWILAGSAWAAYYVKNGGLQDVTSRAAQLKKAKADLNFHLTNLSLLQQSLAALPSGHLPESQIIRARINNEQAVIQSDLQQVVEEAGFLREHWSNLTPRQKDLVNSLQKS
jgi:hypothetical protein